MSKGPIANAKGEGDMKTTERRTEQAEEREEHRRILRRMQNVELKRKEQKERKLGAAKKKKEGEDRLRRKGKMKAKSQPKISIWLTSEGARTTRMSQRGKDWSGSGRGTRKNEKKQTETPKARPRNE